MIEKHNALMASIGSGTTKAGAGSAVFGWIVSQEVLAVSGVMIALLGLCINWYYKRQENARAQAEHELRMIDLKRELEG